MYFVFHITKPVLFSLAVGWVLLTFLQQNKYVHININTGGTQF